MLFQSFEFVIFFLPITIVVSYSICLLAGFEGWKFAPSLNTIILTNKLFLITASLFFYGYWNPSLVWLLVGSISLNYLIYRQSLHLQKNSVITLSIIANLLVLGFFKYANFFLENVGIFYAPLNVKFDIVLPLAISFFTFQQISFLVDIRREHYAPKFDYTFVDYALYISFFPQLIAGPIVRHCQFIPQISTMHFLKGERGKNCYRGLLLFSIGIIKKVFIADNLAKIADPLFQKALTQELNILEACIASTSFALQIYFDFSSYSDMAIALGLVFGISLPINFASPYRATSIKDFWRHWHITLSNFLRDYLYIPLGGSKVKQYRQYTNLLITMTLAGIWHGASWLFVLWGALNGLALALNHWCISKNIGTGKALGFILTFTFIVATFTIFRSENLLQLANVFSGKIDASMLADVAIQPHVFLIIGLVIVFFPHNSQSFIAKEAFLMRGTVSTAIVCAIMLCFALLLVFSQSPTSFIYFNF